MGHQLVAPARAPPCHAGCEIDCRIGLLPGPLPKSDGGVFVFGAVGTQLKAVAHRSKAVMPRESAKRSFVASPGHHNSAVRAALRLPLGQLQFDAAVTFVGIFGCRYIERLEFRKTGGDQSLCRNAE